jgi:hypothetical protein
MKKFSELFFSGGEIKLKKDVQGTWKEKAYLRPCLNGFVVAKT